jgi:hypothetical protein
MHVCVQVKHASTKHAQVAATADRGVGGGGGGTFSSSPTNGGLNTFMPSSKARDGTLLWGRVREAVQQGDDGACGSAKRVPLHANPVALIESNTIPCGWLITLSSSQSTMPQYHRD